MWYKGELQTLTKYETPSLSWWNLSYNHIIVQHNHVHVQGQMLLRNYILCQYILLISFIIPGEYNLQINN